MMSSPICILLLGLVMSATGYKISSACVDVCKEDASSIKCDRPCDLDELVLSKLRSQYGHDVVDSCVTPCRCDKHDHVYPDDVVCKIMQSFAMSKTTGCKCESGANVWEENLASWRIEEPAEFARRDVIDYLINHEAATGDQLEAEEANRLRPRDDSKPTNPWENWCKHQCAEGLGGSACYCDIIP